MPAPGFRQGIVTDQTVVLEESADVRFGSKADISGVQRDVCFVPKADVCRLRGAVNFLPLITQ